MKEVLTTQGVILLATGAVCWLAGYVLIEYALKHPAAPMVFGWGAVLAIAGPIIATVGLTFLGLVGLIALLHRFNR